MGGESRSSSRQVSSAQALALADAGVEYVYARLVGENIKIDKVKNVFSEPVILHDDWTKGRAEVVVDSPAPGTNVVVMTSQGIIEAPEYRRTVKASFFYAPALSFSRTAVSYDNDGRIELDGGVVLSGGLHANGDINTSGNSQALDVTGTITASGSISPLLGGHYSHPWDAPTQADIEALKEKAIADGRYYPTGLTVKPPGNDPRVYEGLIFVDGDLKFQGGLNVSGYAIWVVTGTIEFRNSGYVHGFFYSTYRHPSNRSITVTGNTQITGALLSNGSIKLSGAIGAGSPKEADENLLPRRWTRHTWEEIG
jgi:hypothetical protein